MELQKLQIGIVHAMRERGGITECALERFTMCGSRVGKAPYPFHCHYRQCAVCSRQRVKALIAKARRMQAALGAGFSSLLLTVHGSNVDTSGLPNAVHLLASGCVEMVRQTGFKRAAAGYARVVEVAECGGGLWYPHLHLLAVFPEGEAGPRGYLEGAIGKFFPSASGFSMGEEMVLNLPRFVNYATKIPQGITPERWVELREATQQKGGYLSYGGVLRLTKRGLPPRVRAGVASAKG